MGLTEKSRALNLQVSAETSKRIADIKDRAKRLGMTYNVSAEVEVFLKNKLTEHEKELTKREKEEAEFDDMLRKGIL